MQKVDNVKTVLGHKYRRLFVVIIAIVAIVTVVLFAKQQPIRLVRLGRRTYKLEAAETQKSQEKGLSNRSNMPFDQGMIFVFTSQTTQCFWMKDMRFPLDMIWINTAKQIVHIQQNVSPSSYPHTFCPSTPAKYVIELNAGQAREANIVTNQTVNF